MTRRRRLRIGVLELLSDQPIRHPLHALYTAWFKRQFVSIATQAVSVWCRQLGHEVHYATYYGQSDPHLLLPSNCDFVFIATYTQASGLAYALARLYKKTGARTVIGGPHATSYPEDCARFFDIVVDRCDKALIAEIINGHVDDIGLVSSRRPITELPLVEERLPEIAAAMFNNGRPTAATVIPVLSSIGCPYACDFCIDWKNRYTALSSEALEADIRFLSSNYTNTFVAFHDPNFGVRFDETLSIIEGVEAPRRPPYLIESTLSVLKRPRLARLKATNCSYIAPGIESWQDYSNKSGALGRSGEDKLEHVVGMFGSLREYVPALQANLMFGTDTDSGEEPVELTRQFIRRVPAAFTEVNIPTPFAGTPLYAKLRSEGRILEGMPLALYYRPFLAMVPRNYDPVDFYQKLATIQRDASAFVTVGRRFFAAETPRLKFIQAVRTIGAQSLWLSYVRFARLLRQSSELYAFHCGKQKDLPDIYRKILRDRLGKYAEILSENDLVPALPEIPQPAANAT